MLDVLLANRLFDYDRWANLRICEALLSLSSLSKNDPAARLFSHVLAAEDLWLRRISGQPYAGRDFWPATAPLAWRDEIEAMHAAWHRFLNTASTQLTALYSYQNSKGMPFETALYDIVQHLIIHGQHHRAQIAAHLRARGAVPPATDYIYFTRDAASASA